MLYYEFVEDQEQNDTCIITMKGIVRGKEERAEDIVNEVSSSFVLEIS